MKKSKRPVPTEAKKGTGCAMIQVENKYVKAYRFLADSSWCKEYQLEKSLLPTVKAQGMAFNDGALTQLMACIADLLMWAGQFKAMGKEELAIELEQFSSDWIEEARGYLTFEGLHQRDGDDSKKP